MADAAHAAERKVSDVGSAPILSGQAPITSALDSSSPAATEPAALTESDTAVGPAAGGNENLPPVVTSEVPADIPVVAEDPVAATPGKERGKVKDGKPPTAKGKPTGPKNTLVRRSVDAVVGAAGVLKAKVVKKPAAEKKAAPEKSAPAKKEAPPKLKAATQSPKKGPAASSSPKAAAIKSKDKAEKVAGVAKKGLTGKMGKKKAADNEKAAPESLAAPTVEVEAASTA